jgi:heat-inducible transcriptional repressor
MTTLGKREQLILGCIIESYIRNAIPVGSRYLAKQYALGISPATIRNVMNDLVDMGYIQQPHISAGRIPTDKGYRLYVNTLKSVPVLTRYNRRLISSRLNDITVDLEKIFDTSSQMLGKLSSQLGVVVEPRFFEAIFHKMELIPISERKILAIVSTTAGFVKTIMMEVDSAVSRIELRRASQLVNERLSGLSLREIRETLKQRLEIADNNYLLKLIVHSSSKLFNFDNPKNLHLCGAHNIMSNPEFSDREKAFKILEVIESKQTIMEHFDEIEEDICITIGEENKESPFKNCSIVSARYKIGNSFGTLGVVGPTRMQYAKMIALVDYMGKILTESLSARLS